MATTCPALLQDPSKLHQDFTTLRVCDDIVFSDSLQAFVVTRYNDIVTVLDNPEVFSSKPTVPEPPEFVAAQIGAKCPLRGTLLGLDNPDHDRLRKSVSSFFVPRRLIRFEPLIGKLANELLDDFVGEGSINIKSRFALPLPLKIVSAVAGLDPARWEWVGQSLALFGGHEELSGGTFDEKIQAIIEFHEHVAELIEARRTDRRDDLISHIWNERDAQNVVMTDFEHLSMIPGLLLAGHETTTNLLSMGLNHLLHRKLWDQINYDDTMRASAIEELLRFESAITGMRREVVKAFQLGNLSLKPGDQVFCAYNSGSRDSTRFTNAQEIIPDRKFDTQHLGFGRGMHACLGAPLARLILRIEMRSLHARLPGLRLAEPYEKREYQHVHEGRGVKRLTVAWDAEAALSLSKHKTDAALAAPKQIAKQSMSEPLLALVESVWSPARNVLAIDLRPLSARTSPGWLAGAHVDIPVGALGFRQYSIHSDPKEQDRFSIAVLLEERGTGGSKHIHSTVQQGQHLKIRGPRNHFALRPAKSYLFIAGGIGITPVRSMIFSARSNQIPYQAFYLGSARKAMAFSSDLSTDACVTLWPKDELGLFDLETLRKIDLEDTLIYCCGPTRLISAVENLFAYLPSGVLNVEKFANDTLTEFDSTSNKPFEVVLDRSGRILQVPAEKSLLKVLNENGAAILSTCSKGVCGTCEVGVLEGVPEHRDTVLTREEKLDRKSMMPCVSRCSGARLVLDLW
ncbi:hypothetical protein H2198_009394 [Neophaeococcomyces mojaviensis]|uniref:Uncharacterized protein n=1 Tax=Neophaeococcomyces mojaviensis TaxID=3383035 RepID=A0ACC2ZUS2_9EURO|nr:hypothetical protein H2198_009394 [Knufia sp. JES_112]